MEEEKKVIDIPEKMRKDARYFEARVKPKIARHRLEAMGVEIRREDVEADFCLNVSIGPRAGICYVVALEDKRFLTGEAKPIKIEKIEIPANHFLMISAYGRHPVGHLIAVGEELVQPIEKERTADYALFLAGADGDVKKGDIIGVVMFMSFKMG
ncbi:MAG: DUF22 domain-containing protein [Candidatus Hydrothermarchaeota archaeon]